MLFVAAKTGSAATKGPPLKWLGAPRKEYCVSYAVVHICSILCGMSLYLQQQQQQWLQQQQQIQS